MGKTSSAVKDRYNAKAYDEIKLRVPKGQKDLIREYAETRGDSVNGYIYKLIVADMAREQEGEA